LSKLEVKSAIDRHFVTVLLDVMESPQNKARENPGGVEVLEANGGKGAGLPFLYFSDAKGKLIANSNRPPGFGLPLGQEGKDKGGNVGCPYEPFEIAWFMEMVRKAAPKMTEKERAEVQGAFEALKKKGG
jgi:hypothetical protein